MRKIIVLAMAAALFCACSSTPEEQKVMARFVPERMDDFVWENDLVCYRAYGKALEGNPTSPGFDIWVKTPGELVANSRYEGYLLESDEFYHHDHGNGKDCYKVAVSLGAGASAPLVDGQLIYPATNFRSWEIVDSTATSISFILHYPAWEVEGVQVALDKKITVEAGTYFCKAEDVYTGDFESLTVAAGVFTHDGPEESMLGSDRFAIWEKASDTSFEPEDGMIGVGVYMPGAEAVMPLEANRPHIVCTKTVKPGETVCYYFGSCWTKGNIKTYQEWESMVMGL